MTIATHLLSALAFGAGGAAILFSATVTAVALTAVTARTPGRRRECRRILQILLDKTGRR
jgi:hypothetical protein